MNTTGKTLHWVVDKWLAPTPAAPARVTRYPRARGGGHRCVRVETARPGGGLSIVFFRHDDGSWNVFPPAAARLAMRGWCSA
jgi:hypothetical protein